MKPKAKRGIETTVSYAQIDGNWTYVKRQTPVDMFQRDLDLIEKIKRTNLTIGDQEYLIAALHRLANLERNQFDWVD